MPFGTLARFTPGDGELATEIPKIGQKSQGVVGAGLVVRPAGVIRAPVLFSGI